MERVVSSNTASQNEVSIQRIVGLTHMDPIQFLRELPLIDTAVLRIVFAIQFSAQRIEAVQRVKHVEPVK